MTNKQYFLPANIYQHPAARGLRAVSVFTIPNKLGMVGTRAFCTSGSGDVVKVLEREFWRSLNEFKENSYEAVTIDQTLFEPSGYYPCVETLLELESIDLLRDAAKFMWCTFLLNDKPKNQARLDVMFKMMTNESIRMFYGNFSEKLVEFYLGTFKPKRMADPKYVELRFHCQKVLMLIYLELY
jgi:hypothetical protein